MASRHQLNGSTWLRQTCTSQPRYLPPFTPNLGTDRAQIAVRTTSLNSLLLLTQMPPFAPHTCRDVITPQNAPKVLREEPNPSYENFVAGSVGLGQRAHVAAATMVGGRGAGGWAGLG